MHTGDQAVMNSDGYVQIVGRIKDMIIRGGENVYPREIEEFLYGHPGIADVQVIGVPDERLGEEVCACVIARGDTSVDVETVRGFCEGKIAHFKVPRYVIECEEFPMTVTGKIRKIELRERAVKELGLEAPAGIKTA
jgi:fatty-acyl-CoA synthase